MSPGESPLPVGTVTLVLADVEGSTLLWEAGPEAMTDAVARLDRVVDEVIVTHDGVRPVEQGEGDSFVAAFARASDAVACALDLQRADLAPIKLRIGIHTGEVQLRDEGNYIGPAINRCARLRNIGHGGQTLVSQATHDLVVDHLPEGASLVGLGQHRLRDLARPEIVHQLCHPEVAAEFPALRSLDAYPHNLPIQLTSFVGRGAEMDNAAALLDEARVVTFTGVGGCGKTRLALQVAAEALSDHPDGVWLVDLAPILDPDVVPTAVTRALGLQDELARSTLETLLYHIGDKRMLVVFDNCEHVIGTCAALIDQLVRGCSSLVILATSREPLGVEGEVSWTVPSLSLPSGDDNIAESIELFADRARRARRDFDLNDATLVSVAEICRRLDGMPLAIELAAARVRVVGVDQILDGLHDRFRLLTGGARTTVPRQQTLQASVDWSHDLLTEPERVLFRRLAVFAGGFDFAAAQAVGAGAGLEAHHVLDQLSLLVDKSLVMAADADGQARYRMLETVRQYARDRLADSGDADESRRRHRDYYLALAETAANHVITSDQQRWLDRLELEMDNIRAAFQWSLQAGEATEAFGIAAALMGLFIRRGKHVEGRTMFDAVLQHSTGVPHALRAEVLADSAELEGIAISAEGLARAQEAVSLARDLGDPQLLINALVARGRSFTFLAPQDGFPFLSEAVELARSAGERWFLAHALSALGMVALSAGDFCATRDALEEGTAVAHEVGDAFEARLCNGTLALLMLQQGHLITARSMLREVSRETRVAHDAWLHSLVMAYQGLLLATIGEHQEARAAAEESIAVAHDVGMAPYEACGYLALGAAALAADDLAAARAALIRVDELGGLPGLSDIHLAWRADMERYAGDLHNARRFADDAVERSLAGPFKWTVPTTLFASACVAAAEGDFERAEDVAHKALAIQDGLEEHARVADVVELLALVAARHESCEEGARLLGAASTMRDRACYPRANIYRQTHATAVATARAALGDAAFDAAWAEGAALSRSEAIAYAQRGRGERKRPSSGWASLTPAELDVTRLVGEGLANKDIAARLFVSPRTVQAHLTHIYTKLDVGSRVQLAKEASARY